MCEHCVDHIVSFDKEFIQLRESFDKFDDEVSDFGSADSITKELNRLNTLVLGYISKTNKTITSKSNDEELIATSKGIRTSHWRSTKTSELQWRHYFIIARKKDEITKWFEENAPNRMQRWKDFRDAVLVFVEHIGNKDGLKNANGRKINIFEKDINERFSFIAEIEDEDGNNSRETAIVFEAHKVGVRYMRGNNVKMYILTNHSHFDSIRNDSEWFKSNESETNWMDFENCGSGNRHKYVDFARLIPDLHLLIETATANFHKEVSEYLKARDEMNKKLAKYVALGVI